MTASVLSLKPEATPRRRVLVVEDNLDSVHSMAMLIKMMGHEVQFAINGFAAIGVARKFHPQIVLLDIGLPDCRGHIIAQQLKYDPGLEKVRIIALTGLPDSEELQQLALEAGCDEFYRKPMDPVELEKLLAKA